MELTVQRLFRMPRISLCAYSLQPYLTNYISSWRFGVWCRCSYISYFLWWFWTPNSLCFLHINRCWKKNYAQLEKEALALNFGVKKFHRYLYRYNFILINDHKSLVTIMGQKKGIPFLAAACLQRWAILLSAYDCNIQYKSTTNHSNADGLSRLPLPHFLT